MSNVTPHNATPQNATPPPHNGHTSQLHTATPTHCNSYTLQCPQIATPTHPTPLFFLVSLTSWRKISIKYNKNCYPWNDKTQMVAIENVFQTVPNIFTS